MNKKILYALIFTSIFIFSTVSVFIQPAAAASWKFGVPAAAKGITTESEVMAYDEDEWVKHIGVDSDDAVNEKHGLYRDGKSYDANNVGAKAKGKILDWESEDYWFLGDSLLWTKIDESIRNDATYDRNGDGRSDMIYYWDAITFARNSILGLAGNNYTGEITNNPLYYYKPLILGMWAVCDSLYAASAISPTSSMNINLTQGLTWTPAYGKMTPTGAGAWESTLSKTDINTYFNKKYDAKVMERDIWYWQKDADFESDPDEEEVKTPFIENPEDLKDAWGYFVTLTEILFDQAELILENAMNFIYPNVNFSTNALPYNAFPIPANVNPATPGTEWSNIHNTIAANPAAAQLKAGIDITLAGTPLAPCNDYVFKWFYIVYNALQVKLIDFFREKIPDRAEFLISLFRSGIPAHQDVSKWLTKMVDEFDINEDNYYGKTDKFILDASVDGLTVTLKIEWAEGTKIDTNMDFSDDNERQDYEMVFVYSDTGAQSSMTYQDGDDIFYKTEGKAPAIPGFELSILLGAAAISAIGLIYVIMKKRTLGCPSGTPEFL